MDLCHVAQSSPEAWYFSLELSSPPEAGWAFALHLDRHPAWHLQIPQAKSGSEQAGAEQKQAAQQGDNNASRSSGLEKQKQAASHRRQL